MTTSAYPPRWLFIVFPALTMLLGWGLRGYIGGGPYGALMPGCFVALSIALLLGYRMETAALAALFGAVGIGYGGNMTYGQTLGFLRAEDTVYWGLLGCLVKGTVWGLLGGIVMGLGLSRDHYSRQTLCKAFGVVIVAYFAGLLLINEPKLIYFSDPVNKPRDESWAGLLVAALALLAFLRASGSRQALMIPLRFGLFGAVGGGIGFAGGGVWMVIGPGLPLPQQWLGWWKVMEFFFGFCLGAAFGACAWLNRAELHESGQKGTVPGSSWGPGIALIAYVVTLFGGYVWLASYGPEGVTDSVVAQLLLGYVVFATVALVLGLHSIQAAWQGAITMAFFHTVLDYTRDLNDPGRFGYTASVPLQLLLLVVSCGIVGYLAYRLQGGRNPVARLFLLAIWSCFAVACVRAFLLYVFVFPPEGQGRIATMVAEKPTLLFVHGTFTLSALFATWVVWRRFQTTGRSGKDRTITPSL